MSFDIFLGCFKGGEEANFPRSIVEEAFGAFVERREDRCWVLLYPDGGAGDLYVDENPNISGFSVNRPPASPGFWEGILSVLQRTSSVLFWAGSGCVVAFESIIADLPKDLIETVGAPTVVARPEQIVEVIKRSD